MKIAIVVMATLVFAGCAAMQQLTQPQPKYQPLAGCYPVGMAVGGDPDNPEVVKTPEEGCQLAQERQAEAYKEIMGQQQ
jgi:hypothetical protein